MRINLHCQKAPMGPFLTQFIVKKYKNQFGLPFIYRLKFDAFSDIDNFSIISKLPFFDIDKLPIISKIPIYRLSIIFHRYIAHPYPLVKSLLTAFETLARDSAQTPILWKLLQFTSAPVDNCSRSTPSSQILFDPGCLKI